jgi:hypothetical protein
MSSSRASDMRRWWSLRNSGQEKITLCASTIKKRMGLKTQKRRALERTGAGCENRRLPVVCRY